MSSWREALDVILEALDVILREAVDVILEALDVILRETLDVILEATSASRAPTKSTRTRGRPSRSRRPPRL